MVKKSRKLLYKKRNTTLKKYKIKRGGKSFKNLTADKNKIYLVVYRDPDEIEEDEDLLHDEYLGIIKSINNNTNEIAFEPYYLRQLRRDRNLIDYHTEWIKSKLVRKKFHFTYQLDFSNIEKLEFFSNKNEVRERMKDARFHSSDSRSFSSSGKSSRKSRSGSNN
jgi:hypothetical protein